MKNIRLIVDQPQSGARNMAVDETLMLSLAQENFEFHGFLRFYRWKPATISFGYNQRIEKLIDLQKASKTGLVRRMSGGKMVFHDQEWTFSLGLPQTSLKEPGKESFLQMFLKAMHPFVCALKELGIPARFSDRHQSATASRNQIHCYAAAAGHSIFAGDKKLIGAAGVARGNCLTIHGSIPVSVSFPPADLFISGPKIDEGVNMACLKDFLSSKQIEQLPDFIGKKFAREFNCTITKSELSAEEESIAESIARKKYADLNWKERSRKNLLPD